MNDNVPATNDHHAECLRLLNDLHDLLVWAEAMGLEVATNNPGFARAMEFPFWRREIGKVLCVDAERGLNRLERVG